jgi:hypothetical protein
VELLAAAKSYAQGVRHLRGQLGRSPRDRCFTLWYETLVGGTEAALRELCAFVDLDYSPAEELLPGRGFSNENGKWKQALLSTLVSGRTRSSRS